MRKSWLALTAACAASALTAQRKPEAAPPLDPATAAVFARYDTDKDGVVIRTEFPGSDD